MEECANRSNDFCQPLRKYGDLGRGQKIDLSNNFSFLNLLKMSFTYSYSGSLQTPYPLWSVLQCDTPLRVLPTPQRRNRDSEIIGTGECSPIPHWSSRCVWALWNLHQYLLFRSLDFVAGGRGWGTLPVSSSQDKMLWTTLEKLTVQW